MLPQRTSSLRTLILLLFSVAFSSAFTYQQEKTYPFEKWTAEELAAANTAKNATFLTEQEQQIIFYINLARINPKLFGETYAKQYIDTAGKKGTYVSTLLSTLKKMKPVAALQPDSLLASTAAAHAIDSGKKGKTGHDGSDARRKKAAAFDEWGENCSYGQATPLGIAMQWLIDDGVSSLGHRVNCLAAKYKYIGTSIQAHKKYNWNCVANFGG